MSLRNLVLSLLILFSISLFAKDTTTEIKVNNFLTLGPIDLTIPSGGKSDFSSLLKYDEIDITKWWPSLGDKILVYSDSYLAWEEYGDTDLEFEKTNSPTIYYAGFYIETNRWSEVSVTIESCQLVSLFLDGINKENKTEFDKAENGSCEPEKLTSKLELETGKHFILLKLLFDPEKQTDWLVNATVSFDRKYDRSVSVTTNPKRTTTIADLLNNKNVSSIAVSPNGDMVALKLKERNKVRDAYDNWIEIRNVNDGSVVWTFKGGMGIPEVDWAPDSKTFAYSSTVGDAKNLWLVNLEKGSTEVLLENVKNLSGYTWSENGEYIVYTVNESAKQDDPNFKKYDLPEDRQPGFRDKQFIYRVFVNSKMKERLTTGDESSNFIGISPDSKKILFSKTYYGEKKRPYFKSDYFILDLETMNVDSVTSLYFSTGISWSPDSKSLLILGGSTTFGELGNTLPKSIIPNDYDTQAYIYDIASKDVEAITRNFDPKIEGAEWDETHNVIYFTTTDESYKHLYRYDITSGNYELIDLGVEVVSEIDYSHDFTNAIFRGSSSNVPDKTYKVNLLAGKVELFLDPEAEQYNDIALGKVEDWDFTSSAGQKIKGRIYYPPNFDKNKKYPALVYYYGGTSPIERDFGGRYPKNIWTANGYVIYTLQPSGATGFGTEFSAKHVNDWGTTTALEIIEGTEKFVEAHKFVDPNKLGCLGASYGGFLTMNLITKTDIFAAAISHAGISNLTSYWGVGYWGYWYNSVAAAESFPWNSKDVYVDKSPLFNADKINTPLLLLQGNIDPNVPPGEAMQMYVALKHLGKDVEFIEIDKQAHWILDYDKRIKWNDTILAYFDRYLKGQPEWWNSLYK